MIIETLRILIMLNKLVILWITIVATKDDEEEAKHKGVLPDRFTKESVVLTAPTKPKVEYLTKHKCFLVIAKLFEDTWLKFQTLTDVCLL